MSRMTISGWLLQAFSVNWPVSLQDPDLIFNWKCQARYGIASHQTPCLASELDVHGAKGATS